MLTKCAFLVGSAIYEVDLPDGFALQEVMTVLTLRPGGEGDWNAIVFRPEEQKGPSDAPNLRLQRTVRAKGGGIVEVYDQTEVPGVQVVAWRLGGGSLVCAFNPGHEPDLQRYLDGISVLDGPFPRIQHDTDFQGGDLRLDPQRDMILFRIAPGSPSEEAVTLSLLPGRRHADAPPPTPPELYAQTADTAPGLMLRWLGPRQRAGQIDAEIGRVAGTVREAG